MQRFTMHVADKAGKRLQAAVQPRARAGFAAAPSAKELDPETAAYRYLKDALDSDRIPEFADPESDDAGSEFQRLGTETVPLTGTRTVKFRQTLHKVPVYGSLVTVELDQDNQCLAINSSMGAPKNVSAVAKVAPQDALETAAAASGMKAARPGPWPTSSRTCPTGPRAMPATGTSIRRCSTMSSMRTAASSSHRCRARPRPCRSSRVSTTSASRAPSPPSATAPCS
jgi:hypothetical protein